jgi:CheY-like chemotaxis protein
MIISILKSYVKKIFASISALPPNAPKEHHQWIVFANYLALSAIFLSFGYLCTTIIFKLWLVSFYYVIVMINYIVVLFLQKKGLYKIAYTMGVVSISTCAFLLTPLLGWNSGRASHILLCILITFYVPFFDRKILFIIVLFLIIEYIAIFVISQSIPLYYVLTTFWQTVLQLMHLVGFGSMMIFIPYANTQAHQIVMDSLVVSQSKNTEVERLSELKSFAAPTEIVTNVEPSSTSVITSFSNRTVLVIDDEPNNLQVLHSQLTARGIHVVTAECGVHILDLITLHKPDIILLDIILPEENGYEVCRMIRTHFTPAEMPVIFISAKNKISDLVLGFQAGGNDYVLKPFLHEELVARVEGQLHSLEAFEAIQENAALKEDLADRLLEKTHLVQIQERLTRLLHNVDDALLVVSEEGTIVFANSVFCADIGIGSDVPIVGRMASTLLHADAKQRNLLTAKLSSSKYTPVLFAGANNSAVELLVKRSSILTGEEQLIIFSMRSPSQLLDKIQISEWLVDKMEKNQERLAEIEKIHMEIGEGIAISQAITEFIDANKSIMKQFTLRDTEKSDPFMLGYQIMTSAMALWKEATGCEKWEFAEKSGLWKVHPDENGWQRTATLDKYLDFRKMPKFPRWNTIVLSAQFVLDEAKKRKYNQTRIDEIERMLQELEGVLKNA